MSALDPNGCYAMYLRRSRADLDAERMGAGETLARHYAMLQELAEKLIGHPIPESLIYREIVSGDTVAERPQMQALLNAVGEGRYDGVFCAEIDRLARGDTMDQGLVQQTFMYSSTLIVTPLKIYDPQSDSDSEFFEMKLFFARREYQAIKRRMMAGRIASLREGCYISSREVFGYRRVKVEGGRGWTLAIDEDQAAVVRLIFDLYLHGRDGEEYGTMRIAKHLNDMGLTTLLGAKWSASRVHHVLTQDIYTGVLHWRKRVTKTRIVDGEKKHQLVSGGDDTMTVQGKHPPIIAQEIFDAVQRRLTTHRVSPVKGDADYQRRSPFAGLLKCSACGRSVGLVVTDGKHLLHCTNKVCRIRGTSFAPVEAAVLDGLAQLVAYDDQASKVVPMPSPVEDHADLIAAQQRQLDTFLAQLSRLYDLLEQGVYTIDVYIERKRILDDRIAACRAALEELTRKPSPTREERLHALLPRIRTVLELYDGSSPAQKNQLLKSVLEKIVYHNSFKPATPSKRNPHPINAPWVELFPLFDD